MPETISIRRPTLVLNSHWSAIRTTTLRAAITLVCKGSAKIIDPDTFELHDIFSWHRFSNERIDVAGLSSGGMNGNGTNGSSTPVLRSARLLLPPPEVIVLTRYTGLGDRSITFSRGNLFRRDGYRCQYCGGQPGLKALTVDHVLPKSRGGATSWENCVIACVTCNGRKGDRTPAEISMTMLQEPRKPAWAPICRIRDKKRFTSWSKFLKDADWDHGAWDEEAEDHRCA